MVTVRPLTGHSPEPHSGQACQRLLCGAPRQPSGEVHEVSEHRPLERAPQFWGVSACASTRPGLLLAQVWLREVLLSCPLDPSDAFAKVASAPPPPRALSTSTHDLLGELFRCA